MRVWLAALPLSGSRRQRRGIDQDHEIMEENDDGYKDLRVVVRRWFLSSS